MGKKLSAGDFSDKELIKNVGLPSIDGAYLKCLYWFFSYPEKETNLNEISHILKISKTKSRKIILQLAKEGFIKKETLGKTWRISCNKEHPYNSSPKISFNLSMIHFSGLIDKIKKSIPGIKSIILFGSYRKGDDTEKSDIDLAIEKFGDETLKIKEFGVIETFGYRKNVPVNLYLFSKNKIDLNLFTNIANGIVLDGFLEVKP